LCTRDLWRSQIDALAGDADIIVADIGRAHDFPTMARQILAQAPERFSLAGLSMGGYIAFEVLRQAPDRVSRLALLDTNARADRDEQIKQRHLLIGMGRALGVRAVQAALLKFLLHPSRLDDRPLVDRVLAMADTTGQPAFERQQAAIMGRPDNRSFLAGINCPTLIVVGEQDALTPVKVAQEMHAGIAGSRLEVIADCGHLPTMERPEVASKLLADWLRR
jgi:pimeloyl-ACP methyl ester carboxylesterase